ncbi:MAG: sodium:alanine symporter family protein [Gammaproteobacteria bacterium]|jgi:AGCS family alanine or glycine:cation symporter|nr:sodium:alanine symporter family protein [Gammaproteobacteria bacterium]|tara:strand:- start:5109 stop:6440 length:1332 start_codon:yes stop_codon:yes gene_type:complete
MTLENTLNSISSFIWGPITLFFLLGVGIYLMIGLHAYPIKNLKHGFKVLFKKSDDKDDGDISSFESLMTALSATVGTGNIAGVATAIFLGGPGAIFWMWITALFGMATKYAEAFLAIYFREKNTSGNYVGGPMYYIKNGLNQKYHFLAYLFAFFGMIAAFGIGNGVQANSVAQVLSSEFNISQITIGFTIAILVMLVILGGIKSIGKTAAQLVPIMSAIYILGGLYIIFINISIVPDIFLLIVNSAFTTTAATGGFAGATIWMAIRFGVSRGVFSNEAGLGSSPIAHAAAKTNNPVKQGSISMLEPLIDTLVVCTITAFVILISNSWLSGINGASLTSLAFNEGLPGLGKYIVIIGLVLFAFSTIIGWSYYGEKCAEFIFGEGITTIYRVLWIIVIPVGATIELNLIWLIADIMNGLMALPNLIALILLSPIVFSKTKSLLNK